MVLIAVLQQKNSILRITSNKVDFKNSQYQKLWNYLPLKIEK